jgi:hypothetical protein
MMLTIAYITSREDPKIEWFFDSLHRECRGDYDGIKVVVVDSLAPRDFPLVTSEFVHVNPKPCVWQGKFRRTIKDYWAKCNAANTALCYAPDGWISFMDDLSVLAPGWLQRVREAMKRHKVMYLGSFKKVKELEVDQGRILSFTEFPPGVDSRWDSGSDNSPVIASGSWMYGHVTGPVEAFLEINGYPELLCDSLSFEDCICGIRLEKSGYMFRYDRKMLVYESEELHHESKRHAVRFDKGVSPNDKSHAALKRVMDGNYSIWNSGNLRSLRASILSGTGSFPVPSGPEIDWFDGQPISEIDL